MASSDDAPSILARVGQLIRALCWTITILASVAAGAFVWTHYWIARSGDQRLAVVGLALLLVVVPYAISRGVSELIP